MLPIVDGSASTREVAERFTAILTARDYKAMEPASLLDSDSTLTFVNATITPFKHHLSSGLAIGKICQYQPCVRSNGEHPWLFTFSMAGLLADIHDAEELACITNDAYIAILAAVPACDPGRMYCMVDARDKDLAAAAGQAAVGAGGHVVVVDNPSVATRWGYGDGFSLSGRGTTYFYRNPSIKCDRACSFDCAHGCWAPVANFIEVTNGRQRYAEVGLGVEITAAIPFGSNAYALPEISSLCTQAVAAGFEESSAYTLINLCRVIEVLVKAGCKPGGKGQGSVQRKFIGRILMLLSEFDDEVADDFLRRLGASGEMIETIGAERLRLRGARQSRTRAALALLDRRPRTSDEQLRGTYGLNDVQLAEVRALRRKPPRLRPGDSVAVVSPSWSGTAEFPLRAERGVAALAGHTGLKATFQVSPPASVPWRSATRQERADEFNRAVGDPSIQGILWMIGGVAASQLLDLIDYDAFLARPKVLCGYSDATVLHHAIYATTGCTTLYGPNLLSEFGESCGPAEFTVRSFIDVAIAGWHGTYPRSPGIIEEFVDWSEQEAPRKAVPALPRKVLRGGTAAGPLLPACIPSAVQLLGTKWQPPYRDHVLALDLTDHKNYGPMFAHQELWHLRQAGLLDGLAGLVVSRPRLWTNEQRWQFEQMLLDVCEGYKFPIVAEFEFGHTRPLLTLPIGVPVQLSGSDLELLEPAVR